MLFQRSYHFEQSPQNDTFFFYTNQGAVGPYVADFDAVVLPPCRLLRIPRPAYLTAADTLRQRALGMAGTVQYTLLASTPITDTNL